MLASDPLISTLTRPSIRADAPEDKENMRENVIEYDELVYAVGQSTHFKRIVEADHHFHLGAEVSLIVS